MIVELALLGTIRGLLLILRHGFHRLEIRVGVR